MVGRLPHAREYRNGFLSEANDAAAIHLNFFAIPILVYETVKVVRKPTPSHAFFSSLRSKSFYGTAANFGVLAGLSLAGFEYR